MEESDQPAFQTPVVVAADAQTAIAANATDAAGNTSGCSQALQFVNDQTPPPAIVLFGTSPLSPSKVLEPERALQPVSVASRAASMVAMRCRL